MTAMLSSTSTLPCLKVNFNQIKLIMDISFINSQNFRCRTKLKRKITKNQNFSMFESYLNLSEKKLYPRIHSSLSFWLMIPGNVIKL